MSLNRAIQKREYARVIIKNEHNQFLLLHQHHPTGSFWTFPGGKLEEGESPEEGALREVWEEIGLKVVKLELVTKKETLLGETLWNGYFFYALQVEGEAKILENEKAIALEYVDREDIGSLPAIQELLSGVAHLKQVSDLPPTLH
jgi:mutator protein MutT